MYVALLADLRLRKARRTTCSGVSSWPCTQRVNAIAAAGPDNNGAMRSFVDRTVEIVRMFMQNCRGLDISRSVDAETRPMNSRSSHEPQCNAFYPSMGA